MTTLSQRVKAAYLGAGSFLPEKHWPDSGRADDSIDPVATLILDVVAETERDAGCDTNKQKAELCGVRLLAIAQEFLRVTSTLLDWDGEGR